MYFSVLLIKSTHCLVCLSMLCAVLMYIHVFCVELQGQVASLEHSLQEEQQRCREERARRRLLHNTLVVRP